MRKCGISPLRIPAYAELRPMPSSLAACATVMVEAFVYLSIPSEDSVLADAETSLESRQISPVLEWLERQCDLPRFTCKA